MPRSTRDDIKLHVQSAINHLDNSSLQLAKAAVFYEVEHKDIYDNYCTVVAALDSMKVVINQLLEQI